MEGLFGKALDGSNGPFFVLVIILLAINFYMQKQFMSTIDLTGRFATTLESIKDLLTTLSKDVQMVAKDVARIEPRRDN